MLNTNLNQSLDGILIADPDIVQVPFSIELQIVRNAKPDRLLPLLLNILQNNACNRAPFSKQTKKNLKKIPTQNS